MILRPNPSRSRRNNKDSDSDARRAVVRRVPVPVRAARRVEEERDRVGQRLGHVALAEGEQVRVAVEREDVVRADGRVRLRGGGGHNASVNF